MKTLLLLTLAIISQCRQPERENWANDPNVIQIRDVSKPQKNMLRLNRKHYLMELVILENTVNDTILLGGNMSIPPGKTGLLYRGECFMDSMALNYDPLRATKGKFAVRYKSWKW